MKIKLILFGLLALTFSGCKKLLEEDLQLVRSADQIYVDPVFAQGFVLQAYRTIPPYYNNSDLATDDAVVNLSANASLTAFRQVATGSWTPTNPTMSVWNGSYSAILYVNQFLANSNKSRFANDPAANKLLNYRMRGEAFGLRALHMYFLLRNHAGVTPDGQLMGVPIVTDYQDPASTDFNQPRATFDACVKQIYSDLDSAEYYLPTEYVDLTAASQIPAQYASITQNFAAYNQAMGKTFRQLFNGLIAKSVRSRVALLAASPAFQHASNPATWEQAANAAASVITYKGGPNSLVRPTGQLPGHTFYDNRAEIDALSQGDNPHEMIWREVRQNTNSDRETQNFPPSLFGNGVINPTENLVEAFPMANGYPIGHGSSAYVASNPYANRDPRLRAYILYNAHPDYAAIRTGSQSGTADGINVRTTSTRTGYYLRKTLRWDVSLTPGSVTGRNRYNPRIRFTEICLNYAEAANEAWGPKGSGPNTFSAYDVIKAIRTRAGVGTSNNHAYLEECATDKAKMRELIKNERRLELSFEGFRFWDIRRWKESLTKLNETARGLDINGNIYTPINVEERAFQDHMIYGPIPYSEVLKYSNLKQNANW
ncbi:RagB/SusD family nutrient uptake outer membrane protein [Desertivirga arenae]|uniref:RagB/SusD family nutrient uptake outer membrane protein n=1 Tax=Desertivirga arenae TaxID=2810309 RepID=UPI001A96C58F|nr:RagB/SusD family nutrient uptake outer membrane protein [Pedobacter sp. SYSU D00823]